MCSEVSPSEFSTTASKYIEMLVYKAPFENKKKKAGLRFNPGLVLTGVRTTGPCLLSVLPFETVVGLLKNENRKINS